MPRKLGLPKGRELRTVGLLEVKATKAADGSVTEISGYAAVFGNVDLVNDVIDQGAFAKTIAERVPKGLVKVFDTHSWTGECLIGTVVEAKEDAHGLFFRATVSQAPSAQDIALKIAEGHLDKSSIGYDVLQESYEEREEPDGARVMVRHLKELRLLEVTACPLACNEETAISAKSLSVASLPIAPLETPWDPAAALERVKAWATKGKALNTARFRRAFALVDAKAASKPEGYSIQLADIVGGQLQVVPAAVLAAAKSVASLPAEDQATVRDHVETHMEEIREATGRGYLRAPWEPGGALENLVAKSLSAVVQDREEARQGVLELLKELPEEEKKSLAEGMTAGPATKPPTESQPDDGGCNGGDELELRERSLLLRSRL